MIIFDRGFVGVLAAPRWGKKRDGGGGGGVVVGGGIPFSRSEDKMHQAKLLGPLNLNTFDVCLVFV